MADPKDPPRRDAFPVVKKRTRFLGLTVDECVQFFFGGNALVAVLVLGLITLFLFREGSGFFGQNRTSLEVYRKAGLEWVDYMRDQEQAHTALTRYLFDIRLRAVRHLMESEDQTVEEANAALADFDRWSEQFSDTVLPLRGLVGDLSEMATATKEQFQVAADRREEKEMLNAQGETADAAAVEVDAVDFGAALEPMLGTLPYYEELNAEFAQNLRAVISTDVPPLPTPELQARLGKFTALTEKYVAAFPQIEAKLKAWDYHKPVPDWKAYTSFITGQRWLTASFWQDFYGVLPLLVGSLMVSAVALVIAVPLGVGAAIYTNQVASAREQRFIKPSIEFISALPSVVLGFFGIVVLGEAIRQVSQWHALSWVPGFPIAERLNVLTAGVLLALIAIPTIFTLAEDALNNIPRSFQEASFALGATRLQTIVRITVPAALSGIISAVLLGFGRVIGETMVVLLCAGNRIAIPDFSEGLAAFTQPVHTMTGIIAQEMGEVVQGSIHYRALFMVGMLLFVISLLINFIAQKIVRRFRITVT